MARKRGALSVFNVKITGIADKGMGVGRDADGYVIFVERVVPGDVVDVRITRKKPDYMEGFPTHYHRLSEERIEPFCEHFGVCGGCQYQNLNYDT
ncbi:MAG: TRAM domain-containing protein, partial [Calditrichia bacterium]